MKTLYNIFHKERETYYNYATGKLNPVWPLWLTHGLVATIVALNTDSISDEFLGALLTVYSILTGFGFSVLFNLASAKRVVLSPDDFSLEKKEVVQKVNNLKDELFTNISYFSVGGLILVIIVLWLVFVDDLSFSFLEPVIDVLQVKPEAGRIFDLIKVCTSHLLLIAFITALVNNLWSFFRIIMRINFYFSERMALE